MRSHVFCVLYVFTHVEITHIAHKLYNTHHTIHIVLVDSNGAQHMPNGYKEHNVFAQYTCIHSFVSRYVAYACVL